MKTLHKRRLPPAKSTDLPSFDGNWFALAKAICVDPFNDDYWERERRYFEERDDRMFNDKEEEE